MNGPIDRLLSRSSAPIGEAVQLTEAEVTDQLGFGNEPLGELLAAKNGFFAFESALLVRPFNSRSVSIGTVDWNQPTQWKSLYDKDLSHFAFFGEDAFGFQFGIMNGAVYLFDPETADISEFAASLGHWAEKILEDYNLHTGFPVAHEWQEKNGPLNLGERLAPKKPFVLGGSFDSSNLYAAKDSELISFRAQLANQLANVSDGEIVQLEITD